MSNRTLAMTASTVLAVALPSVADAAKPPLAQEAVTSLSATALKDGGYRLSSRWACNESSSRWTCRAKGRKARRTYRLKLTIKRSGTSSRVVDRYRLVAISTSRPKRRDVIRGRAVRTTPSAPFPAPTPTPAPAPPPPPPAGTTRENPLPLGATGRSGNWDITVVNVVPDATATVLAENMFNEPPGPGGQFFLATVRATYTGPGSDSFMGSYRLRAVGPSAFEYRTFSNSCGVIPNDITSASVFTGGTIEGNVCWSVSAADATALVMFSSNVTPGPPYWSLR